MKSRAKVKILVGYHKPAVLLKSDIYTPIHLGRALALEPTKDGNLDDKDYQWLLDNMIGDDTGDNISELNRYFNETTGIYWAWKNYEKLSNPEYIGFCHYRRILDFTNTNELKTDEDVGCPSINYLCENSKYLNSDNIRNCLKNNKYIIAKHYEINPVSHFENIEHLHVEDYYKTISILKEKYPKYAKYADIYNKENKCYFCNLFILPKEDFFEYAQFLFDMLFEINEKIDKSNYSICEERVVAYISEWLTGIFFTYLKSKNEVLELAQIYIKNTDLKPVIKPETENETVLVMNSDENYIPYLAVTIQSIIENSNPDNLYKIFVLNDNLSKLRKRQILDMEKSNIRIKFIDVGAYLREYSDDLWFTCRHFSKEVYFRFFIPEIFKYYKKVLYCDCDAVFLEDPSKLFNTDMEDNIIGAVIDTCINAQLHTNKGNCYFEKLNLKNPAKYFNSGLMLFNIQKSIEFNLIKKCIKKLKEIKQPLTVDQDVLNIVCEGRVKFLDERWNVENHIINEEVNLKKIMPSKLYYKYISSLNEPKYLHYTSDIKPWQYASSYNAHYFWKFARKTSFYEEIIYRNTQNKPNANLHKKEKFYNNFLQRLFSVKNNNSRPLKPYKILTIFGIKFKFKNNKALEN